MNFQGEMKSCEDLNEFIDSTEEWLNSTLTKFGLSRESLNKNEELVVCPVDSNHRMPSSALEKHLRFCALRKRGYTDDDIDDEGSSQFFYQNATTVVPVKLDLQTMQSVCRSIPGSRIVPNEMPLTVDRYNKDLNSAQRLAVYNHVIQTAVTSQKQTTLSDAQMTSLTVDHVKNYKKAEKNAPKSDLEMLAMKRDMKRRRQSYKGKSYTAAKSYKQVISQVINNQTDQLREKWTEEQGLIISTTKKSNDTMSHDGLSSRNTECTFDRSRDELGSRNTEDASDNSRDRQRSRSRSPHHKKKKSKKHRESSHDRDHHKEKKKHKKRDKDKD